MNRLPVCFLTVLASAGTARAGVCDRVLGAGLERLSGAPLWYHVGDRLLSPVALGLIALAFLTATRVPRLRGIALIAGLVAAVQAVTAIGDNAFPDKMLLAARIEGCGDASVAAAIVSSFLAFLLLGAFLRAPDPKP